MVSRPEDQPIPVNKVKEERVKVAINPEHPEQTVMIGSRPYGESQRTGPIRKINPSCSNIEKDSMESEAAFRQMKEHIAKLPMLTAPEEQEELIVYLAASKEAVITDQPIKNILSNPEVAGRMQKWSIQLGEFGIQYRPRVSVKGQVLADFIMKDQKEEAELYSRMPETGWEVRDSRTQIKQVLIEELKEKSVNKIEVLAVVEEERDSWMTPIHEYLTDETLPAKRKKARAIKRKSQRFAIINEILYKKSFLGPWLRCVGPSQANYVLREIHEGSCSMHAGTQSVIAKALRIGYYWPTMHKDAKALIKACQECQVHKPVPRNPQEKFYADRSQFGLPGEIISDNGKQF
ncbi:reverse transcriptase domain-containing protein [Tanacetum coccineum]